MIIEKINNNVCNMNDFSNTKKHLDKILISSELLLKRVQKLFSESGFEIGVSLDNGETLKNGDILYEDEHRIVYIEVLPEEVIVITPTSIKEMGIIAHNLGNRHLPAQFDEGCMILANDYLVEELLKKEGVPYQKEHRVLPKPFKHASHKHI
ncbi:MULTISPECIES: urease accessory protein UreE [Bacillus cereus group]|uniref:Urease accessory protein UreE n=1 Tax=Bacillus cereus TaxID=1396 RepID=A0A2B8TB29_BACCE|nr:urease accessory protein UreE [Bacillus cereus]PDY84722.1 urease accessory protein UreE [Bacillus cereus]PFA14744.1 urease accessory protein UreE [Bacillus cereus]PFM38760.1 urease accessory protein UreE [Bacillus cereus]PGL62602.1 urease accessory protein UreE [Bacillus cereus]PGQ12363.1 urease accessory protein UreE [Bacillus cereus]